VLGVFVNAGFDLQRSMAGTLGARGIGQVFEVDPGYPHPMQSNFGLYRIVASEWLNIVSPALFAGTYVRALAMPLGVKLVRKLLSSVSTRSDSA